ncbi:hypothetical protein [Tsukamurella sp. PLM1]|uniref:hypothetical protein n=1 Tax=Tsukamurella sp. PLM1 TaxID=2929795 RepID=UPI0020BD8655|nr:hypothetical protein [Tsukamurella sp. PLM1]
MTDDRATPAERVPRPPVEAVPPLVLHPRGGVVIGALLVLTLGLMVPLVVHLARVPIG